MRLFFGIDISKTNKEVLIEIQNSLIFNGKKTVIDNIHLTLVFLGEINGNEYIKIINSLNEFSFNKFDITINKVKMLRDMVIGEVENNNNLNNLQLKLKSKLVNLGILVEDRKYYPHVTLSRKSDLKIYQELNLVEEINEIVLFESKFIDNGVKYFKKNIWKLK